MKGALLTLIAVISICFSANAQLNKTIHHTFDTDEITSIQLNLYGEFEIEKWAGNNIMTETSIELYDSTDGILNHFLKEGRWNIEEERTENAIILLSKDMERKSIRTKKGECFEILKVKLYIPEEFKVVNENLLERNDESTVTAKEEK